MHEISLVQGLFQQLTDLAKVNDMTKVIKVTMQIGPLSGVVQDSFRFGFTVLSEESDLVRGAELEMVTTEVTYRCITCSNAIKTTGEKPEKCAFCDEAFLIAEGGDELILQSVEME